MAGVTAPTPELDARAFDVPEGVAYFNTASLGPMPRRALEAGHEALRRRSAPWTVGARAWFDDAERLRSLAGALLGADAEGVALVPATSYGLAVAAHNLAPRGRVGGAVLVLADEFPSGVYTWRTFAARTGAPIVTVDREPGQGWTEAVLAALDERVGIVSVPNVHWTDGSLVDLAAVARRAREVDAALVVDASQSLGAMPLDVAAIRPDFVVSVGYKWLLGPVGRAYLWVAEQHRDGVPIEDNWIVRAGADDFAGLVGYVDELQPGARRFDAGGRTQLEVTPMAIAAVEQVLTWGVERIGPALGAVTAVIADRLAPLGLTPTAPAAGRGPHILGVTVPAGAGPRVVDELERRSCYVGLRGSTVRIAPHLHVTGAHVDTLVAALAAAMSG